MSRRDEQNWIAFGFALAYILCFLALPYYRLYVLRMNGWNLMAYNPILCLPLVLGLLMVLASLLFSPKIGAVISGATVAANFILMLTASSVLNPASIVQQNVASLLSQSVDLTQPITLGLTVGIGAILSLLFAVVVLVLEILAMTPKKHSKPIDKFDFDF